MSIGTVGLDVMAQATPRENDDSETNVEYTHHVEPPEQGGEQYVRCESCGAELLEALGGKDRLVHRNGCPAEDR